MFLYKFLNGNKKKTKSKRGGKIMIRMWEEAEAEIGGCSNF